MGVSVGVGVTVGVDVGSSVGSMPTARPIDVIAPIAIDIRKMPRIIHISKLKHPRLLGGLPEAATGVSSGGNSRPQKRHTTAARLIVSAQNGQIFVSSCGELTMHVLLKEVADSANRRAVIQSYHDTLHY
jgi:hypothetical protein